MRYTHLSERERYVITYMHMAGFKPAEIARRGPNKGTFYF